MPIYTYECSECKLEEEVTCSMSDMDRLALTQCPRCGGKVARVITNTNKHTDNTPWRKGHYNSKDDWH